MTQGNARRANCIVFLELSAGILAPDNNNTDAFFSIDFKRRLRRY
jgi:hypothetical protein